MLGLAPNFWRGAAVGPNTASLLLDLASSQYAQYLGAAADYNIGGTGLTLMQWVKHTALGGTQVYQGQFDFTSNEESYAAYYVDSGGDQLRFRLENPAGLQDFVQWAHTPPAGAPFGAGWDHYAFVWDGTLTIATGSMKLYIDAVDQGAPAALTTNNIIALKASTARYAVGAWNATSAAQGFMNGFLDETRVYQATLTQPEIAAIMNSQAAGVPAPYHHFLWNNDFVDAEAGADLTGVNGAGFSVDVPFA